MHSQENDALDKPKSDGETISADAVYIEPSGMVRFPCARRVLRPATYFYLRISRV